VAIVDAIDENEINNLPAAALRGSGGQLTEPHRCPNIRA
jgi:hypothetical protein